MDVLQNSRTVGTVFPDYVTVDIFNAILFCNGFVCDFDRLKQFDQGGVTTTNGTGNGNSDSSDDDIACTIGVNHWCNWSLIIFFLFFVFVV